MRKMTYRTRVGRRSKVRPAHSPRRLRVSVVAVTAVLVAAGCGSGDGSTDTATDENEDQELTTVAVGYRLGDVGSSAPWWIAEAKGWFEELGLDVEPVKIDEVGAGIIGGSLQVGLVNPDEAVQAVNEGAPGVFVCGWRYKQPLIVGVGEGVDSVEDLDGAAVTLGLGPGDPATNHRAEELQQVGWDLDAVDVEFATPTGFTDNYVKLMEQGRIKMTYMFPRHVPQVEAFGGTIVLNKLDQVMSDVLIVDPTWAEQNADVLEKFLQGSLRGKEYLLDPANRDDIVSIMTDADFEVTDEITEHWEAEYFTHTSDCQIPKTNYAAALTFGGVEDPGFDEITDFTAVNRALEALGKPELVPGADID